MEELKNAQSLEEISMYSMLSNFKAHQVDCVSLFHYTWDSAKNKIVSDKGLDFELTPLDEFLDKNEGIHILEPYYHACGNLYDAGQIDKLFFELARKINVKDVQCYNQNLWVLSFSANGYSQFLKERYAPGDGWIIGIQKMGIDDLKCCRFEEDQEDADIQVVNINYSFEEVKNDLISILKEIYRCYQNDKNKAKDDEEVEQDVKSCIKRFLATNCNCYKSTDYSQEEEIRVILKLRDGFKNWTDKDGRFEIVFQDDQLHLKLDKKYIYNISQEMSVYSGTRYNKSHLIFTRREQRS